MLGGIIAYYFSKNLGKQKEKFLEIFGHELQI